jgi:hypothetical protein
MGQSAVTPQTQKINEFLSQAWKANKLQPSRRTSDHEFLRRVYIDLIGRIATAAEVREFERNPNRAKLVKRLLYDQVKLDSGREEHDYADEFARNWANIWTVWLMTRTGEVAYRDQIRDWLTEHFRKNGSHKEMVEQLLTATGDTDQNGAVNYILRHLGESVPDKEQEVSGYFDMVPLTARTTRLFLGMQTQCVQCHDHPFYPDWKQHSFWSFNVFFRQVARKPLALPRRQNNMAEPLKLTLLDDDTRNSVPWISYDNIRRGTPAWTTPDQPTFLDGRKFVFPRDESRTRRRLLAELVVSSEMFPKAYINRVWGHLFGRGLNELPAVDDFGEHNKVVHPELLDYLAKEFVSETSAYEPNRSNAFDPKKLLYWICTSEAYNLSSAANASNDKPEAEPFFSRVLLKSMSPEQLFESLAIATGAVKTNTTEWRQRREDWLRKLVVNFGDDEGNEITFNGTLLQALLMMNGREMSEAIKNIDKGTVAEAMRRGRSSERILRELFYAALNRPPTPKESADFMRTGRKYGDTVSFYFYSDVFWALLNSNEFILNH